MAAILRRSSAAWLAFPSLLLVGLAWTLALPLDGAPDETAHLTRAAGVARGELVAPGGAVVNGTGGVVTAPLVFMALAAPADCFAFHPHVPAGCSSPPPAPSGTGQVASGAARYFPLYYGIVGLPTLLFPNALGWYLARVVSMVVVAAVLAGALASASALPGPLPRLGVLAAATPTALFLSGSVNPSSWEIAGGIGVWAGGAALLFGPAPPRTALLARLTLSGLVMVSARGLSPMWLALIAGVLLLSAPFAVARDRIASRGARAGIALLALAAAGVVAWDEWQGSLDIGHMATAQYGLLHRLVFPLGQLGGWLREMVGVFGWLDTPAPLPVFLSWTAVLATLVMLALSAARGRLRLALIALGVLTIAVPVLVEAATANRFGFVWQGRYTLPFAAGAPILAAVAVAEVALLESRASWALTRLSAALLALAQMSAFWVVLVRYESGLAHPLNPLNGSWYPPVGPLPVLVMAAAGLLGLACAVSLGNPETGDA